MLHKKRGFLNFFFEPGKRVAPPALISVFFDIDALLLANCMIVHAQSFCLHLLWLSALLSELLLVFFWV